MSSRRRRSIVVVCAAGEPPAHPIAPRLTDLLEHGWDAHVVCEGGDPSLTVDVDALPAEVQRLRLHPPPRHLRTRAPRRDLAAGALRAAARRPRAVGARLWSSRSYLDAVLLALEPQVIHLPSREAASRYLGAAAVLGARVVVSLGDEEVEELLAEDTERIHFADGFHVESEALLELLRRRGLGHRPAIVIPPVHGGVPGAARDAEALHILGVGPLTWAEGYEYALQAVSLLADRGIPCRYRIVGRGEFAGAVAFAVHQLDLEGLVEVVEPDPRATLADHLVWADVLVSAAVAAGSRRAIVQAQAAGVPVVATEAPPGGEETALVVGRRDPEALAGSLGLLAADPEGRRRLAHAGRGAAGPVISDGDARARFRELYAQVLGQPRPRGRLTFRPLSRRDLDPLFDDGSEPFGEEWLERQDRSEVYVAVAELDGVPVGRVGLDFARPSANGNAYLWSAHVRRGYRSRGVGTALCRHLEEVALERGFEAIQLDVDKQNRRAQRLYARLGYDVCGEEVLRWTRRGRGRPVDVVEDCWTLRKQLRPRP